MRGAALVLGWLWTLPNTVLWVLVALAGGARPYRLRPAGHLWFVARGFLWKRWAEGSGFCAITVGACTISAEATGVCDNAVTIRHERQHVYQAMCLGLLYLPAYGLGWLLAGANYRKNWMEADAYGRERDVNS